MFIFVLLICFVANFCSTQCVQNISVTVPLRDNKDCIVKPQTSYVENGEAYSFYYEPLNGYIRGRIEYIEYKEKNSIQNVVPRSIGNQGVILRGFSSTTDTSWIFSFYYDQDQLHNIFTVNKTSVTKKYAKSTCETIIRIKHPTTTTTAMNAITVISTTDSTPSIDISSSSNNVDVSSNNILWYVGVGIPVGMILICQSVTIIHFWRQGQIHDRLGHLSNRPRRAETNDTDRYSTTPGHRSSSKDHTGERESTIYETVNIGLSGIRPPEPPAIATLPSYNIVVTPISQRARFSLPREDEEIYEDEPTFRDNPYELTPIHELPQARPPIRTNPNLPNLENPNVPPRNPMATFPKKQSVKPPINLNAPHCVNSITIMPKNMKPKFPNVPVPNHVPGSPSLAGSYTNQPNGPPPAKPNVQHPTSPIVPRHLKRNALPSKNPNVPLPIRGNAPHDIKQHGPPATNKIPPYRSQLNSKPVLYLPREGLGDEGRTGPRSMVTPKPKKTSTAQNMELEVFLTRRLNAPPPVVKKPVRPLPVEEPEYYEHHNSSDEEWTYEPLKPIRFSDDGH